MPLRESWEFFRQFRERFETTGAILPSSRFLARAMTRPLARRAGPVRVLEVGPGTGAVTNQIVKLLKPEDTFDLVEINDQFANHLRAKFKSDTSWNRVAAQSQVHVCPLQEFRPERPYDIIISGLPFNNFPAVLVQELIDACLGMLAPQGDFAFFEYIYIRSVKRLMMRGKEGQRLGEIERILQSRFSTHRVRRDWVFPNLPPAWVQHLTVK